jgi:hypothetical protein
MFLSLFGIPQGYILGPLLFPFHTYQQLPLTTVLTFTAIRMSEKVKVMFRRIHSDVVLYCWKCTVHTNRKCVVQ